MKRFASKIRGLEGRLFIDGGGTLRYISRSEIAGPDSNSAPTFEELSKTFHTSCTSLHFHQQCVRFPILSLMFSNLFVFFDYSGRNHCWPHQNMFFGLLTILSWLFLRNKTQKEDLTFSLVDRGSAPGRELSPSITVV